MELVLDVYKRHYSKDNPVLCMDESPRQLIRETRIPIKMEPGSIKKYDYEYQRCGTCNIFIVVEPLTGKRAIKVTQRKTKKDWALFIKDIADQYPDSNKITLIMDNYCTHKPSALYEMFAPEDAKNLWDRFEFVYTPKHGSWLNIAEIELSVLQTQCLNRRIESVEIMKGEINKWKECRNNKNVKVDWQFTTENARIKLKRLYPSIHA